MSERIYLSESVPQKPTERQSVQCVNFLISQLEKLGYSSKFSNRLKAFSYVLEQFLATTNYEYKVNSPYYKGQFHSCFINAVLVHDHLQDELYRWAVLNKDRMNEYLVVYIKEAKRRKKAWRQKQQTKKLGVI